MEVVTPSERFLSETASIAGAIDSGMVEAMVEELCALRSRGGRLYLIGMGGSAANCSHAANDFRKLCAIEAYAPTDNVAELTARANDEGLHTIFSGWFLNANEEDALMVFSVGGGSQESNVSMALIAAVQKAHEIGMRVFGIVGRDGGYTKRTGDCVIVVPPLFPERVTPHTEAFQGVIWHALVSHPSLQTKATKW